ncbi:MAG: DNA-binding protein [Pseudomonadota bacterium]
MKVSMYVMLAALLTLTNANCSDSASKNPVCTTAAGENKPAGAEDANLQAGVGDYSGTVVETMNTAGYTYVQVDTGKEKIWAAAPECQVKVGDKVTVPPGAPMKNYFSKTLNRTFETVYFVGGIGTPGAAAAPASAGHGSSMKEKPAPAPAAVVDFKGIKKPEGGKTVEQIFAEKKTLAGKMVTLRGKVVKFNAEIMNKNWAHLQDGTGAEGSNDLTVTTGDTVKVGDTVLVNGAVVLDKDFGYGYKYDVLIDNATIKAE